MSILQKHFIGIDPGKDGGIAVIFPDGSVFVSAMPQTDDKIDQYKLAALLRAWIGKVTGVLLIGLEDVHAVYGSSAKSTFEFGRSVGIIQGVLSALDTAYIKVPPKTWQKVSFEGVEKIKKGGAYEKGKGTHDNKAMAAIAASRLYPDVDLRKNSRCTNPHDGIVDAVLIAHYLKTKY